MGSIPGQSLGRIKLRRSRFVVSQIATYLPWKVTSRSRTQVALTVRLGLFFLFSLAALSDSNAITQPAHVCHEHTQLTTRDHMKLGVRILTANPALAESFRRALDFWTRLLDMEWYEEQSDACSLQLTDAAPGSLEDNIAAITQVPGSSDFEGLI